MKNSIVVESVEMNEAVAIEIVELDDLDLSDVAGGLLQAGGGSTTAICSCTVNAYKCGVSLA